MIPIVLLIFIIVISSITFLSILGSFRGAKSQIKYRFVSILLLPFLTISCANAKDCNITESTFFLVMTNIHYYPEEYIDKDISLDCFTYNVKDIKGDEYLCGVRKCTAGYGCRCGKDSVIGFILHYDGDIPEPKNQYEDTNEKSWIHIVGQLSSIEKTKIEINSYDSSGNITDQTEIVEFLSFDVSSLETIEDYSKLAYFVGK